METKNLQSTMTENEVQEVLEVINNTTTEDEEYLKSLPSSNGVLENNNPVYEPITETVNVATNLNNGLSFATPEAPTPVDEKLAQLLDINPEDLLNVPENINDIELRTEDIISNAIESYGFKEEDVKDLLPIIDRYKAGEDIKYKDLPLNIKRIISQECHSIGNFSNEAKNLFTEALLDGIIRDSGIDKIKLDMEEAMSKAFDFSELNKSVAENTKFNFEVKLLQQIEELEAKGETEKVESIKKVLEQWKESHNLTDFKEYLKKVKIKKIEFEKINRVCEELNYKYENQRYFTIHDVKKLHPALGNVFSEYKRSTRDALVIAFCKYCRNKSAANVADHTFMSYFVLNTLQLIVIKDDNYDETSKIMKQSLKECLDILAERY